MSDARSRPQRLFDTVVGTILAAMVLSFFALLWKSSEELHDLKAQSLASQEVMSSEVAKLRTGLRRLEEAIMRIAGEGNATVPRGIETPNDPELTPSALKIQETVKSAIYQRALEAK